jgi:hypothetical protein
MRTMETKDLMGLLPESAVILSQRPPLWHSRRERRSYRALLCRSCLRLDIEGQLHAICPLFVNFHTCGSGGWGCAEGGGCCVSPHELLVVCEMGIGEKDVFLWNEKSAPFKAAGARRALCLVISERGCMRVFDVVFVCVSFGVGVSEGCGLALCLRDECVGPCADRHF